MDRERRRSLTESEGERDTVGDGVRDVAGELRLDAARLRVAMAAARLDEEGDAES